MAAAPQDRLISRDRLATFAFAAADLLVEIAPDGSITWAAGAFPARFGEQPECFVGRGLSTLIAVPDHPALARTLMSASLRGHAPPVTLRLSDAAATPCAIAMLHLPGQQQRLCVTLGPVPAPPPQATGRVEPAASFARQVEARLANAQAAALGLLDVQGMPAATDAAGNPRRSALHDAVGEALGSIAGAETVVGEVADGRFGVLSQRDVDIAMLTAALQALVRARPDGKSVAIAGQVIGLSAPELKPAVAAQAVRFALARFAASGAAAVVASGFDAGLAGFVRQAQGHLATLRQAIADRRFDLAFQPVVALRNRVVHHYEALLRPRPMPGAPWQGTQEFVACVEALGLAEDLDLAVLEQVLRVLDRAAACAIASNMSGLSVQSETVRQRLHKLLPTGSCRRLLMELTETAEIEDIAAAATTLEQLRAKGISVCLDDFGAGAAAFRYIRDLPVDYLKIDAGFVQGAERNKRGRDLVASMVELARSAGAQTIAEGVETPDLARLMEQLGCGFGQGWLFGKPAALPEQG